MECGSPQFFYVEQIMIISRNGIVVPLWAHYFPAWFSVRPAG